MIEESMIEFEDKWVRIMADYCAHGVWCSDGAASHPDELPISPGLREMLCAWNSWYDHECDDYGDGGFPTLAQFVEVGALLARLVKQQLPGWTVIYFDEGRAQSQPPAEMEIFLPSSTE